MAHRTVHRDIWHLEDPLVQYVAIALSLVEPTVTIRIFIVITEGPMALLSSATVLRLVDSMAVLLAQAYQLARARLVSSGSPVLRALVQRDQEATEVDLLRREVEVFRAQRESVPPNRRPTYEPAQRLAILQLRRLRGWSIKKTAEHFVVHRNTIRSWVKALEGKGRPSSLNGTVV